MASLIITIYSNLQFFTKCQELNCINNLPVYESSFNEKYRKEIYKLATEQCKYINIIYFFNSLNIVHIFLRIVSS